MQINHGGIWVCMTFLTSIICGTVLGASLTLLFAHNFIEGFTIGFISIATCVFLGSLMDDYV